MQKELIGMVEITTFTLNQGVTAEAFEQAAQAMQMAFLAKQAGFIKRTLTLSASGVWTDIVSWQDEASAKKAMQAAENTPEVMPFMEKIDFNSVKMDLTKPIVVA